MPPRLSRSSVPNAVPKAARSKNQKRSLDAYAAASAEVKEKRIPQHRLGEDLDDEPRSKRRRVEDEDEEGLEEDSDGDQQAKQKARRIRPIARADDDIQYGSDSSGNEWTTGGLAEDADDSELDSDEAFGESDEERFEGFTFRGSSSGKAKSKSKRSSASKSRSKEVDLDEHSQSSDDEGNSDDDAGEGLGDDAVDLAAMLDESDEEIRAPKDKNRRNLHDASASEEDGDEDEDEDEDEEEEESELSESDDDNDSDSAADEERVARMMDRLEKLDSSRAPRQTTTNQSAADLTLEDFLSGVDAENRKRFEGEANGKKKSKRPTTISAPLPKRQQDRLDREIATQKAKEQLDRWRDTVIRNRRAEFLSFPMVDPRNQSGTVGKEKFVPANQDTARTDLEESIQRIMEESGLATNQDDQKSREIGSEEAALLKSEELATNKLPIEEVMRRRAELRKARELLFREEIKARRIAKIKSKSYRRVHRKERERLAEQEKQALQGLGGDDFMDDGDMELADRKRAEARVATKHKDSKWAKALKATNRTVWDDNARDSVMDLARRNEDLKRRIAGKDVSDDEDNFSSDSDDGADENAGSALERLNGLQKNSDVNTDKGLSGLKFMRAAEERKRKANDEDVERLRKELAIEAGDEDEPEVEDQALGRAIFGPQANAGGSQGRLKEQRLEFEAPDASDTDNDLVTKVEPNKRSSGRQQTQPDHASKTTLRHQKAASGPLANAAKVNGRMSPSGRDSSRTTKSEWLSKQDKDSKKRQNANESMDLILDLSLPSTSAKSLDQAPPPRNSKSSASEESAANSSGWTKVTYKDGGEGDSESEEESNPIVSARELRKSLQQRAFAGDDVEIAFDAEKADVAESEDEKEISNHLPGWGAWTGEGLSKSVRKANERAKHNPLFKSKVDGVRRADRKDANLKNVIISEKQDRKGKKYLAPILPHGYETKAQYERSRRLPMGPEWSTKEVHQRMARPRVVVKPGVRVDALERPLV